MRLIDADKVIKNIANIITTDDLFGVGIAHGIHKAINELLDAPAVDAVDVVRCKDCMMFCPQSDPIAQHCFVTGNVVSDDDFCSFGERREENEVD